MPDTKADAWSEMAACVSPAVRRKRLALARTLCHLRPVMILDDPFSALDKKTEAEIFSQYPSSWRGMPLFC